MCAAAAVRPRSLHVLLTSLPPYLNAHAHTGLLICSFGLYALTIAITVCCFVFYTHAEHETCGLSKFYVAFNLVLCILVTALSVHPRVQEGE